MQHGCHPCCSKFHCKYICIARLCWQVYKLYSIYMSLAGICIRMRAAKVQTGTTPAHVCLPTPTSKHACQAWGDSDVIMDQVMSNKPSPAWNKDVKSLYFYYVKPAACIWATGSDTVMPCYCMCCCHACCGVQGDPAGCEATRMNTSSVNASAATVLFCAARIVPWIATRC